MPERIRGSYDDAIQIDVYFTLLNSYHFTALITALLMIFTPV